MKKWLLCLGGLIVMTTGACSNTPGEEEILDGMDEFISFHPTEDLTAFFDREGFRDNNFQEEDKGVWNVHTSFGETIDDVVHDYSLHLQFNRNTNILEGSYFKTQFSNSEKKYEEKYKVVLKNGELILMEESQNELIQAELDQFQFLVQLLEMDREYLDGLEKTHERYVSEVPLYELNYELPQEDPNVQSVITAFESFAENGFSLEEPPVLKLYGNGNLEGSTVGRRQIEIFFGSNRSPSITSSINYRQDRNGGVDDDE